MNALLLLLLACDAPPTPSVDAAHRLAEALAAEDPTRCAALIDAELRGHCENALGVPCEAITPGPWQDECYFARGEARLAEGAYPDALSDCVRSGPFGHECFTHLFKAELGPLVAGLSGEVDVASATAAAEAVAARYVAAGADTWSPPWGWWWRVLHQRSDRVDLLRCDEAPSEQHRACVRGARDWVGIAWSDALRGRQQRLCAVAPDQLNAMVVEDPDLAWAPHPDLDAVVARTWAQACGAMRPTRQGP
ncbi:MAG: hypothetical protein H6739_02470 [Alphaproteobacteria bacterium]|nr:hypothetical protein [Alphaproteobacteria bacterium]